MADVPLYQLLVQLKLTAYEQGLTDAGHDKFEQLVAQCQDNEAELLSDLVNDAKMKKPKAKKLIFALRLQGSSAPPAPQSEGEVDPKDPGDLPMEPKLKPGQQEDESTGETKEPTTTTTATMEDGGGGGGGGHDQLSLLALRLVSHHKRVSLLRRIFSFHKTRNPKHYINLRSSSKLFHRALPQPPPLWTSYPCSNHATLQSLVNRLEELRGDEESSGNVPSVLFIEEGEHREGGYYVTMKKPLSMYGAGCGLTTLVGVGLKIEGNKSDGIVEIQDFTIKGGEGDGLGAWQGMKVIMRGCTIEECGEEGVYATEADITCDDLQVIGCGYSGVCAYNNATITLSGHGTSIQGNGTKGDSNYYGLKAYYSSSFIHLVPPLTKEQISKENGGGGNWGRRHH